LASRSAVPGTTIPDFTENVREGGMQMDAIERRAALLGVVGVGILGTSAITPVRAAGTAAATGARSRPSWADVSRKLADEFPTAFLLPHETTADVPAISQPIDTGAQALLGNLQSARLSYNPALVERLFDEIKDHLEACSRLKDQAQQLEDQAFREGLYLSSQRRILAAIDQFSKVSTTIESKMVSSQTSLKINSSNSTVDIGSQDTQTEQYWSLLSKFRTAQIGAMQEEFDARLAKFKEQGGGSNFSQRFDEIKKVFDNEFKVLYQKARALSAGLKEVYDAECPVPPITDVGYLTELIIWGQKVADAIDVRLNKSEFYTILLPLHDNEDTTFAQGLSLMTKNEFHAKLLTGTINFPIPDEKSLALPSQRQPVNPRLRGLDLWFSNGSEFGSVPSWAASAGYRASVTIPNQSPALDFVDRPTTWSAPWLLVRHISTLESDQSTPTFRQIHNASPIGTWSILLNRGINYERFEGSPIQDAKIYNMFIRMKLLCSFAS
jgi:hypothetical protein